MPLMFFVVVLAVFHASAANGICLPSQASALSNLLYLESSVMTITYDPVSSTVDNIWNSYAGRFFDFGLLNASLAGNCQQVQVKAGWCGVVNIVCDPYTVSEISIENSTTIVTVNEQITNAIKGSLGLSKFSFEQSTTVKTAWHNEVVDKLLILKAKVEVRVWVMQLDDVNPKNLPLAQQFLDDLKSLPLPFNASNPADRYYSFVNTFGDAYIKSAVLGGTMNLEYRLTQASVEDMRSRGIDIKAAASAYYGVKAGITSSYTYDTDKTEYFQKNSMHGALTCVGGSPDCTNINLWKLSIIDNPAVIDVKFGGSITSLMTPEIMPSVANITQIRDNLIKAYFNFYNRPLTCYKDCSGHGKCVQSVPELFNYGICICDAGFSGPGCETNAKSYSGIMCGYARGCQKCNHGKSWVEVAINCDGVSIIYEDHWNFRIRCPPGYNGAMWNMGGRTHLTCLKPSTDEGVTKAGTLCGLSDGKSFHILCSAVDPAASTCPAGYARTEIAANTFTCVLNQAQTPLPGTLCGMGNGCDIPCGNEHPAFNSCPEGTVLHDFINGRKTCAYVSY